MSRLAGGEKIYIWAPSKDIVVKTGLSVSGSSTAPFLNEITSCWGAIIFSFPILCGGGLVGNDIGYLESNSSLWPLTASLINLSLTSWSHQALLSSRWPKSSTSFAQWPCPSSGATASSASARAAATAADMAKGLTETGSGERLLSLLGCLLPAFKAAAKKSCCRRASLAWAAGSRLEANKLSKPRGWPWSVPPGSYSGFQMQ